MSINLSVEATPGTARELLRFEFNLVLVRLRAMKDRLREWYIQRILNAPLE